MVRNVRGKGRARRGTGGTGAERGGGGGKGRRQGGQEGRLEDKGVMDGCPGTRPRISIIIIVEKEPSVYQSLDAGRGLNALLWQGRAWRNSEMMHCDMRSRTNLDDLSRSSKEEEKETERTMKQV